MPFYEYLCKECGHKGEMLEKVRAGRMKKCPVCGALKAFKRQVSKSSFQLKGKGWYKTDFKGD